LTAGGYDRSVSSVALGEWAGVRASRLDQLVAARQAARGGRYPTQALNWSLVLVLASEFQGFSRELHGEAANVLAAAMARGNSNYFTLIRNNLVAKRALDRVNASSDALHEDFDRLGLDIWRDIASNVKSGARWNEQLKRLNRARNAIAHNNMGVLQKLRTEGYPITSATVDSWRSSCNGISGQLDALLTQKLTTLTGARPW
jgi:hypothetical protein